MCIIYENIPFKFYSNLSFVQKHLLKIYDCRSISYFMCMITNSDGIDILCVCKYYVFSKKYILYKCCNNKGNTNIQITLTNKKMSYM